MRWGRPFTPETLLWEVDDANLGPEDRRRAHLELVVRTRTPQALAVDDFVSCQGRQIEALRSAVGARTREGAGRWILRLEGGR